MTTSKSHDPTDGLQRSVTVTRKLSGRVDSPNPALGEQAIRIAPGWALLAVCCSVQLLVVLDISVVNVALPQMKAALHLSTDGQQWVINAYTLTFAGLLMLGGRASDLFGGRRVLLLGLTAFIGFSLLGGLAQGGAWLITARAFQGASGAALAPTTLRLLTTSFSDPAGRRRAIGLWSAAAASGASIGVLAGGVLTDYLSWRWVLIVNVPIGLALLAGAVRTLPKSRDDRMSARLDVLGAMLITSALAALVYGVVNTRTHSWDSYWTISILTSGAVLLGIFIAVEVKASVYALIPLGVFRRRSLSVANGVAATVGASILIVFFFLSLYFQEINDYSPLRAGFAFLPVSLSILFAALTASKLMVYLGPRFQLMFGLLLASTGLALMAHLAPGDTYLSSVLLPEMLFGTGFGLTFVPMTLCATAGIPPQQMGLASGLVNTSRQIGGAIGLAVAASAARVVHTHSASRHAMDVAVTGGYDRAFEISAGLLIAGLGVAILMPGRFSASDT